jgi:hypothetical protein
MRAFSSIISGTASATVALGSRCALPLTYAEIAINFTFAGSAWAPGSYQTLGGGGKFVGSVDRKAANSGRGKSDIFRAGRSSGSNGIQFVEHAHSGTGFLCNLGGGLGRSFLLRRAKASSRNLNWGETVDWRKTTSPS